MQRVSYLETMARQVGNSCDDSATLFNQAIG
jgi:hypothetical protein